MRFLRRFTLPALLLFWVALVQAQSTPAQAQLTFTTIDVPGAVITNVLGINSAGDMVGDYGDTSNAPARGFVLKGGSFALFDYPGGDDTVPVGINDSDLISGSAFVQNYTEIVSFLYDGNSFTTIQAPGKSVTDASGINNAGVIVGGYGSLGGTKGFVLIGTRFKTISPPGSYINVFGNGINTFRQIVGIGDDTGFLYSHGQFKTLAVPGAITTHPWGINDSGIIVGSYEKCSPCADHGFVLMNGKYLSLNYPGASATLAFGVNASGQVVGSYTLDGQSYHGFVTSPITAAGF